MIITTEQAKKHLKLNTSLSKDNFAPFIPDAERKYIKPFLGEELFSLIDAYASNPIELESPRLAALFPYVEVALSRFTLLIAAPSLDLHVGEQGFGVISSGSIAPASRDRVRDFMASIEKLAWDNIEDMIRFLENNKDDYSEWVQSEAFTMHTKNLINSAVQFSKFVDIEESRLTFHRLRQDMANVEDRWVKTLISEEQFDAFIEMLRDGESFSPMQSKLLYHLQSFVANLVAFLSLNRNAKDTADFHFAEARSIINKFPDEFPLFAASTLFDGARKPFYSFTNSDESSIFNAIP